MLWHGPTDGGGTGQLWPLFWRSFKYLGFSDAKMELRIAPNLITGTAGNKMPLR
jgi:hypothetical protein